MEKKVNARLLMNQSNSSTVSESRKSQDVSGKQWPRNGRRREPTNTKSDAAVRNKTNGNKNRNNNSDKRLYDRNGGGGGHQRNINQTTSIPITFGDDDDDHDDEEENNHYQQQSPSKSLVQKLSSSSGLDIDEDNEVDYDESMYSMKNKKPNLNALLRFRYGTNELSRKDNAYYNRIADRRKRLLYKRDLCLQSKCKFIVRSNGDYKLHNNLPDQIIEWDIIEQIYVESYEELQCPICLYHPIAAKMSQCGHIFCWPCILHYLDLSDRKTFRKCPICHEVIHQPHLKSVISRLRVNYKIDDSITFQLMWREKGSVHISRSVDPLHDTFPHLFDNPEPDQNCKLILANTNEILSIISRERDELQSQLICTDDNMQCDDEELKYIQKSLNLLDVYENELKKSIIIDKNASGGAAAAAATTAIVNSESNPQSVDEIGNKFNKIKLSESNIGQASAINNNNSFDDDNVTTGDKCNFKCDDILLPIPSVAQTPAQKMFRTKTMSTSSSTSIDSSDAIAIQQIIEEHDSNNTTTDRVYFYQSSDCQHIYLHRINIRMLEMMFGSMDKAPAQITCKILQKHNESMTEQLRKRYKDLQHLPTTCPFDLVEVDLNGIVSGKVLRHFKDELVSRHKKRQRKAHEERKREKRINRVNDQLMGCFQSQPINIDVTSIHDFPTYGASAESQADEHVEQSNNSRWKQPTAATGAIPKTKTQSKTISFATMLALQTRAVEVYWPSLGSTSNNPSTSMPIDVNVAVTTGANIKLPSNNNNKEEKEPSSTSATVVATAVPISNVFDELNMSFDGSSTVSQAAPSTSVAGIATNNSGGGAKKKKKKNKTTLYSTGGRFNAI